MKGTGFLLGLLIAVAAQAQQSYTRCGTYELMQQQEQLNPGYLNRVEACFQHAKQVAQSTNTGSRAVGDTIYRIRTVFHIVYTNATENIADSNILSQLEVLNEDFRRLNADTANTRQVFKPFAADAGIEFYLADTDPDGNPTTGITRTQGTPGFLGFDPFTDNVKSAVTGGKDPWPTDRYLNIWVCNLFGGIVLGYAFPPDNAPNWPANSGTDSTKQGVVLHYAAAGRIYPNPIDASVDMGRSLVHELGHYFGLRHIWGDGDCTEDDGISDTPDADAAQQQTCDTTSNTCVETPFDYPDMIENYMDYSDDRCLNMFTHEQVGVIRAMLQTSRSGIATPVIETGIKHELNNFETVTVSPSPSTGTIQLKVKLAVGNEYSFEITNLLGEKILQQANIPAMQQNQTIQLDTQPSGIYFVRISSAGQSVVRKFQLSR